MAKPELKVVVLGDSAMWGQGLLEKDKFSTKSAQEIGKLLGREARIVINSARSGAVIRAGRTSREKFVDTFPHLFASDQTLETNFIKDEGADSQGVALNLHRENPASFPTVEKQVQRVPESVARETELVLLNGGANDLNFEEFIDPLEHRNTFVKHYDPVLKEITLAGVSWLLGETRKKFPNALIVYTGYFAPFAPGVSNTEMTDLFENRSGNASYEIWINNNIIEIKNTDQLVLEAQLRTQFGVARGLHWTRKAIAEANADPKLRGPGILFIHPQFGPENTVFASNSFFHREYEISKVKDAAKADRVDNCPRIEHFEEMKQLLIVLQQAYVTKELTQRLLKRLNGPSKLLKTLARLAENPADVSDRSDAATALEEDLKRISRVRFASFVHPNENGAQRYTNVIVKRYTERHQHIRLRDDLHKLQKPGGGNLQAGLRESLKRYGFGSQTSVRAMSQLMLVDSIALEVTTAASSEAEMFDDIFLNLGGENHWQLNFPPSRTVTASPGVFRFKKILHPHFEPGATDLFSVDPHGIHLGDITQFVIERQVNPVIAPLIEVLPADFSKGEWRPTKISLYVNGIEVFSVPFFGNLTRNGKLTFPYPQ